jgi:hypothetical protein
METIIYSRGRQKGPPERDPADSLACSGLRARLRLDQRLLRFKDGSGLWWAQLSSEIVVVRGGWVNYQVIKSRDSH